MRPITVTALADCVYAGRSIALGEVFTLPAVEAAIMRDRGLVALESDEDKTRAARAARQPDSDMPQRRRGRRRISADD